MLRTWKITLGMAILGIGSLGWGQAVWTKRNPLPRPKLSHVTWTGKYLIGVGADGAIATSPDGITWIPRSSGTTMDLRHVLWTGTQAVAVGDWIIATSSDGTAWNPIPIENIGSLYSVSWTGRQYLALGSGPYLTSPDGKAWTLGRQPEDARVYQAVWTGTRFVGRGGSDLPFHNGALFTSPDGIAWTRRESTRWRIKEVFHAGDRLFALGESDTVLTSQDGDTWSRFSMHSSLYNSLTWAGDRWIAVGDRNKTAWSMDGQTWHGSDPKDPYTGARLKSVAWTGSVVAAVSDSLNMYTSADTGKTWLAWREPTTADLRSVIWTGKEFLAMGAGEAIPSLPRLASSADGVHWTRRPPPMMNMNALAWDGNLMVAASSGGNILHSRDGAAWETFTFDFDHNFRFMTWTGRWFAAAGSNRIVLSKDGIAWEAHSAPSNMLWDVAWTGSLLVAVGDSTRFGNVFTSTDGAAWTRRESGTGAYLRSVTWTGNSLVAVGSNGAIITSPDGMAWTRRPSGTGASLRSVRHADGRVVCAGSNVILASTTDGATWTKEFEGNPDGEPMSLVSVASSGDRWMAVGDAGLILGIDYPGNPLLLPGAGRGTKGVALRLEGATLKAYWSGSLGPDAQAAVYDYLGRRLATSSPKASGGETILSLEGLPFGRYLLRMTGRETHSRTFHFKP